MELLQSWLWAAPTPTVLGILLATGLIVTRREHRNMEKMMEYFRQQVTEKDKVIATQAEALGEYREAAKAAIVTVSAVREIAGDGKDSK